MAVQVLEGDCRTVLETLPSGSVQCIVTSPPYYGLRDYGVDGQMGLEESPDAFVAGMVGVFRECRRVLRDDGTLWLNIGDSYSANHGTAPGDSIGTDGYVRNNRRDRRSAGVPDTMKPKDLMGIPWMLAFALRADGWYLRMDIIWSKPNPMPESVRDRPTKSHEYVFLLTKAQRYFYDQDAILEPVSPTTHPRLAQDIQAQIGSARANGGTRPEKAMKAVGRKFDPGAVRNKNNPSFDAAMAIMPDQRNARSVWSIATHSFSDAHFATMPPDLARRCILAGTSEKGECPRCGMPWSRVVERTPMVLKRSERTHDKDQTRASGTMVEPPRSETIGWEQSCECPAHEPVPQTVLDPFGGAGTTGLVADRLRRNALLIELNADYAAMARRRIASDAGMFAEIL